ncbi:uncharacterized protein [Blastocystis hominis]|uniref:Mesencephalic astrocyte-derived neurotrophic factor homolog n=1 Tax=Blastocystis hominis TaxID=12968 RepID=D8MBP0_BLAHO|nr:uncharacterized protein [Blastocystis hominis]CBK25479.2 unnamed protein product [Blastocystis hominis]|eukprot:XP_012899527.1 uncharacterized protein [Blastocystis hominis]
MGIILFILVCIDVVSGIEKTLTDDDKKDITLIEDKISTYCKQKKLSQEQKKICYHIDPIKREVSLPLSYGMPAEDICIRKLNKKNNEFCSVKYSADKPKSSETFDPSKMRISQLKAYLAERGQKCVGCYEKSGNVQFVVFERRLRSQGEGGDERRVVIYGFYVFRLFV